METKCARVKPKSLTASVNAVTVLPDMAFKDISTAQEKILIAYKTLTQKLKECPTASEVAEHLGITTRAVFTHLEALEDAGYVIRRPGRRNIILTDKAK